MNPTASNEVGGSKALASTFSSESLKQARSLSASDISEAESSGNKEEAEQSPLQVSVTAELDHGFKLMTEAAALKRSGQTHEWQECLENANAACEESKRLVGELPAKEATEFQLRLNALQSVVLDATSKGLARAMARG